MKKTFALIVRGLFFTGAVRAGFGEEGAVSGPATRAEVRVELTSPKEWEVFQRRDSKGGEVEVAGVVTGATGHVLTLATSALVSVSDKDLGNGAHAGVGEGISASRDVPASGKFDLRLTLPAGGWHSIHVEVRDEMKVLGEANVEHVGVGEVFVVGGQSNSTNYGEVRTKTVTGMVTVFDGTGWTVAADPLPGGDGKGGGPWCHFEDDMYEKLKVPIGIVPVGKGSTSVRQWLPKGDIVRIEPSRDYGLKKLGDGTWESEGTLFDRMVGRMKQLDAMAGGAGGHGFRAMLWHQGESDAHQKDGHTLPGEKYRADLERVIRESRKEVGWEVPWFVATATWGSPESPADPDIRSAQEGVVADGVAMAGPDTDTLLGENRQKHGMGVHMSAVGLKAHGGMWAEVVGKWVEGKLETQNTKHKTE
ncbi:MAG: sialate O-acetylesterase [Phycisphaerae bacterium]